MGGREINVDSDGVRRAAKGKLADAADGTGRIAGRIEGLAGGGQLGGSEAAAALAGRERATQSVFSGTLQQAHQELSTHRDSLLLGMNEYDRADDESASASDSVSAALPTLGRSGITGAFDRGRDEAGSRMKGRVNQDDEIPMTEQEQQLAAEANSEARAEARAEARTEARAGPGQPGAGHDGGVMQD